MMKSYDQEMFDFFTAEDAFINLCKIGKHLPAIKAKLLEEFWNGVERELIIMASSNSVLKVVRVEYISSSISKLMLYKSSWGLATDGCPQLAIGYERLCSAPFYGPFVHNRVPQLNHSDVTAYLRSLPIANEFENDRSTWYPFWDYTELGFKVDEDFLQILPSKSDEKAHQFAKTLFELGVALETELDGCSERFRLTSSPSLKC